METDLKPSEEVLSIPHDMSIDVLGLIVKERLKHQIIEVNENRSLIVVLVFYDKKSSRHQKVIQNLKNMIEYYHDWRWAENEDINWKED